MLIEKTNDNYHQGTDSTLHVVFSYFAGFIYSILHFFVVRLVHIYVDIIRHFAILILTDINVFVVKKKWIKQAVLTKHRLAVKQKHADIGPILLRMRTYLTT